MDQLSYQNDYDSPEVLNARYHYQKSEVCHLILLTMACSSLQEIKFKQG